MTETYDEHMAEMLRLGGAHECASDCPLPAPRQRPLPTAEQPHARHIEWGINVVDCQDCAIALADPAEHPSGPICAACGGTDAPVVDVPLHPKCAEHPSGSPQTEAGRDLRERLLSMFRAWERLAAQNTIHVPTIEDPAGWIIAIEREAAARREGEAQSRQKHAAWCWLPLDHQGQCEGDQ